MAIPAWEPRQCWAFTIHVAARGLNLFKVTVSSRLPSNSMQCQFDTPDNRHMVNAVLQAATDYNLLVEVSPPTAGRVHEFLA